MKILQVVIDVLECDECMLTHHNIRLAYNEQTNDYRGFCPATGNQLHLKLNIAEPEKKNMCEICGGPNH